MRACLSFGTHRSPERSLCLLAKQQTHSRLTLCFEKSGAVFRWAFSRTEEALCACVKREENHHREPLQRRRRKNVSSLEQRARRDERISFETQNAVEEEEDKARRCTAAQSPRTKAERRRSRREHHQHHQQTKEEATKNCTKNPRETSARDRTKREQRASDIRFGEWEHAFTPE